MTPQETEPDLAVSIQESPAEAWVGGGLCRAGGTECSSACMALLEEVAIIFMTSIIVWPQVNNREGMQLYPSIENWIKVLLNMARPITRPISPSVSLSHQQNSISLLSFSIRGQAD